ncbi:MAG: methyltransferase domain-containing protein [Nocardioides sp.]
MTYRGNADLCRDVAVCKSCGYVAIAELDVDRYRGKTSVDQLPTVGARAGTMEQPGREYQMARLAMAVLGRASVDVLVYGAGRSLDNHHIATLPGVAHVAIGDIMNVRDDMEFHDANLPATRTFDVVVASEVVEHFRDPHLSFAQLLQFVPANGLLVCGTSLRGPEALRRQRYLFYPDHTSLYTPQALQILAARHDAIVDFRAPTGLGPRKRYVIFARSREIMDQVSCYFGYHNTAPSECTLPRQGRPLDDACESGM